MTGPPPLEVSLLGPPRVRTAGEPVSFDTRKATALLAHLAVTGRPRSREALCELLWPGRDAEHARGALRRTLSTLRGSIGEAWLDAVADSVALADGPALDLDVRRFRALARPEAPPEDLVAAATVFRGELLEGFAVRDSPEFDAWCALEADALRRELGSVLGRLVRALVARGEHEAALPHVRRWVALDPLHEPAHRELIRVLALLGDRAGALEQYRACVRTLTQELGVAPTDETAALFEQVSEGAAAPAAAEGPTTGEDAAVVRAAAPAELPLVGRDAELDALLGALRAASPDGRLAVVEGEAGVGKSRLLRELVAAAPVIRDAHPTRSLTVRCHEDEAGVPYGPVVELLAEAVRGGGPALGGIASQRLADASLLLPELTAGRPGLPPPVEPGAPGALARLLDGVAAVLGTAGLVVVDDAHAADAATLDVLGHLARRLRGRPLLLVLAWRSEAVPPGHRLRRVAAELAREGAATTVALDRLREADVARLVDAGDPGAPPELAARVHRESEGLPLFVGEHLAARAAGREPGDTRDLLGARFAGLGSVAHQVLETAAVLGRAFDADAVRLASGRTEEEVADALDELVRRGVVREAGRGYDFLHGRLRGHVQDGIGLARQRLLHRRAAAAHQRGVPGAEGAALAAVHLRLAGDHAAAAQQHRRAADHATAVLAHRDALEHLDAALALGDPEPAAVHERMGDLRTLVGDYAGALAAYESAAAAGGPEALARVEHKLGGVHHRRGEWDRAAARFAVAAEAVPAGDTGLRARVLVDLALALHHGGQTERAAGLAAEAAALAEAATDERAQARAHNVLGALARDAGRLSDARAELDRSLELASRLGDPAARAAALNNLALVEREAGALDRALTLTEAALALAAAQGDRHREAALENNLADLHHAAGRQEAAMAHLKRAVAAFAAVGADDAPRLPGVWALVSW